MGNVEVECPVCEESITITERDMRLAIQHKAETGETPLVSCSNCCRCLVLPDAPQDMDALAEWKPDVSGETCVPFLDDEFIREPNGVVTHLGAKTYTSGGGTTGLTKRAYMYKYGINPECAIAKNPNMGGKPFVLG
jgi:hypothetical protein